MIEEVLILFCNLLCVYFELLCTILQAAGPATGNAETWALQKRLNHSCLEWLSVGGEYRWLQSYRNVRPLGQQNKTYYLLTT
jgi:hypothetical protein